VPKAFHLQFSFLVSSFSDGQIKPPRLTKKIQASSLLEQVPQTKVGRTRLLKQEVIAKMVPKELNFITGNANKLAEVRAILGDEIEVKNQSLDLLEIQGTIEEVSSDKCRRAAEIVNILIIQLS
jgi:hypothetical protein